MVKIFMIGFSNLSSNLVANYWSEAENIYLININSIY